MQARGCSEQSMGAGPLLQPKSGVKTAVLPGPLQMWGIFELSVGSLSVRNWFLPGAARVRFTLTILCRGAWKQKFRKEAEHQKEDILEMWRYQKASATSPYRLLSCGSRWDPYLPVLPGEPSSLVVCGVYLPRKCAPTKR
ncbi:hypothetical protein NEUTE1DRAFT_106385 [Neurospora tetrasperma FGSC 2508]|uniref:Uncharacterized protein n=1 Tax=Neurospora tetrasperma (strain FGSC 2508 / ATCC MYA-4615 / P0657) TaxID=510951 RepID=F8N432_NEUT8|nr:uncharacterized protein NEUTE1DRAFT_106385 [Neurospora tetrasperma FGSC 2508]EGO53475.1 hypothetical protein NEUTE1DRAFT_106385 [Neurospora tetrasperma FGSC 2508]